MRRAAIILLLVAAACGGSKPSAGEATREAGCDAPRTWRDEGAEHVSPPERVRYDTDPPTSGAHYSLGGVAPAATGVHVEPVQDEAFVHNLEHGHVVVQYVAAAVPPEALRALQIVVRDNGNGVLMAPRTGTHPYAVAFVAWRVSVTCAQPNEKVGEALRVFIGGYGGKGPEGFIAGTSVSEAPS